MRFVAIFFVLLVIVIVIVIKVDAKEENSEAIFRRTVASWQTGVARNDWSAWSKFCNEIWDAFASKKFDRLEAIGALEEGILTVERIIFEQGQPVNQPRDVALAEMYTTYAKALMNLDSKECTDLAFDPHTLLIGSETADRTAPDTRLCQENAENSLRNAASLDATNLETVKLISEITGGEESVHKRKPKEFVAELFDSFADTFDDKLLNTLEYKVPQLIGNLVKEMSTSFEAVLDAGCGTGLAGRYIRPMMASAGIMIGVDASQKMLDKAKLCTLSSGCGLPVENPSDRSSSRPLYDGLVKMDLEDVSNQSLSRATGLAINGFDLIVAADVFVYFGTLDEVLKAFAEVSTPTSRLVFTCELATEEEAPLGWRLLPNGRFAHTKAHAVQSARAANYELAQYEEIVPRVERSEPVRGHLFYFKRMEGGNEL